MDGRNDLMLLDTCALLWLVQGGGKLSPEVCEQINREAVIYVSAISGFEIEIKHRKGKLLLPASPSDWFKTVVSHHDLYILPLDLDICIRSTQLPAIHSDPCDRFIIATAEIHKLQVVTANSLFAQYGLAVLC